MKQFNIFGKEEQVEEKKYSVSVEAPVYEPKNKKPNILELCNRSKANRLLREINASNLPHDEKEFLISAAMRHNIFNYEKIADY